MTSPNDILRNYQIKAWKKYSPEIKTWIMIANFFFAILPGIVFITRNVFIEDETVMSQAAFGDSNYNIIVAIYLVGLVPSLFQMFQYNRFMSLRLVRTYFFGQCISIFLLLLSSSDKFISTIRSISKQNTRSRISKTLSKIGIFCLILVLCYIPFFIYVFSGYSEI